MLGGGSSSSSSSQGNGCGGAFSSSSALPPARRHQHHHHHHQQETGSAAAAAIVSASSCWSPTNPFNVLASGGRGGGVGGGSVVTPPTASEQVPTETAAVALSPANFLYANYPPPPPLLLLPSSTTASSPLVAAAAPAIQRKRPGCLCDHQDDYGDFNCHPATTTTTTTASSGIGGGGYYDDLLGHNYGECGGGIQQQVIEPLDLSLPKVKVRQHWSGGSIVQVNDSTIISISGRRPALSSRGSTANNNNNSNNSDSTCCCGGCCADSVGCPNFSSSSSSSRLDVSVVTVPQPARPSCWSSSPSYANQQQSHRQQQQQQQQQQPFRLQIEIPFGASDDKLLPGFFRHHHRRTNNNKPIHCHNNNNSHHHSSSAHPPEVCATMTEGAGGGDESDDLQRLSDSAHQLRLSGYYYGHLSWKESVQLLQNTKVGTFLVRDSSDARYLYALSLQTDKGPTSVRIHYSSSGFRLDACSTGMADHLPRFRTVLDLVDHYVAKWSQCRDKGQFWLDNSGQVHSEVVLIRPLMRDCPSLKHLCRLACNNQQRQQQPQPVPINSVANCPFRSSPSSVKIPPTIKSYLNEYPYQH